MLVHDRVPNLVPRCMCPCSNPRGKQITVVPTSRDDRRAFRSKNLSFHCADNLFGFIIPTIDHQPPRTLGNPAAKENHNETERRANSKSETPSQPNWDPTRIEQHKRRGPAERGADPGT